MAEVARRRAGDGYSRLVAWLKIILPLIALAMLSTLFLVSRTIDPSKTVPYADVDVEGLARDQRIGAPSYNGMTEDGTSVSFRAESVRPRTGGQGGIALRPVARIGMADGRVITITAETGEIDQTAGRAALQGAVVVESSDGYRMETGAITARLDRTGLETPGPVSGTAPFGRLTAGRMILTSDPAGGNVLRFEAGVKLLYRPGA